MNRPIRSFVRREGRVTPAQQQALEELWPRYGVDETGPLDWVGLFGRAADTVAEIGYGNGEALVAAAQAFPERNFLGIEVYKAGTGRLLMALQEQGITNVRTMMCDAAEVMRDQIAPASLAAVHLFFPDPWPKKRHHKRRLLDDDFAALVANRLQPGGDFLCATDWENYAEQMHDVLTRSVLENKADTDFASAPAWRPTTKFERRGRRKGHGVWDLHFQRSV